MTDTAGGPRPVSDAPLVRRGAGVVAAAVIGFAIAGPVVAIATAAAVTVAPVLQARRKRRHLQRNLGSEVAGLFELAARAVRSGVAFSDALAAVAVARPGPAAELVVAAFDGRCRTPGPSHGRPGVGTTLGVVTAVAGMVGGTTGGTARGLEAGAMILRERERADWEIAAGIAQARTSALLLGGAPIVLAGAAMVLVPGGIAGLLTDPFSLGALVLGGVAEVVGLWWTRHLIRGVEGSVS